MMQRSTLICGLAGLFYCYEYLLRIAPSVMLNELMAAFHISATMMGQLAAYYYYAYTFAQLPVGLLLDRFGPRNMLSMASLCCTAGSFMFSNSLDLKIAGLGRFLVGFGSAFAFIGVLKLGSLWFSSKHFAIVTGLVITMGTLGVMLGNIMISWMIEVTSWRFTLQVLSLMGVVLTPILWFFIKDAPNNKESAHFQLQSNHSNLIKPTLSSLWQDTIALTSSSQFWINALIGCLLYLPTCVFNELWGHSCLLTLHNLHSMTAATAISMTFLGWAIGSPIMGYLSEKTGKRKIFLQAASILCLILFSLILYVPALSISSIDLILFFLGFFSSPQILVLVIAKENSKRELAATSLAFINFIIMMGGLIFQPLVGILLDMNIGDEMISPMLHHATNQICNYPGENYVFALSFLPIALIVAFLLTFLLKSK